LVFETRGWEFESLRAGHFIKEAIMPTVRYLDTSMYGSYYVECEVLEKIDDDTFKIKFYDDIIDEYETKVVNRDRLKFPEFNEYAFC
jgi:hypothetical protein